VYLADASEDEPGLQVEDDVVSQISEIPVNDNSYPNSENFSKHQEALKIIQRPNL
jgi:hypothetical protein